MTQPPDGDRPAPGEPHPVAGRYRPGGPYPLDEPDPVEDPHAVEEPHPLEEPNPLQEPHPVDDPRPGMGSHPGAAPLGPEAAVPPPRRSQGLVLAAIAVVTVLLLGGGSFGAWLLLRDSDRGGALTPGDAVEAFLRAVYLDRDAAAASSLVCSEARDEKSLAAKIDTIRAYADTYLSPRFTWSGPAVVDRGEGSVVVRVRITMITGDERIADQTLHITVVDKGGEGGWWVCDVEAAPQDRVGATPGATPDATATPADTGADPGGDGDRG
ncbi:MAG TPA: hypothetical protein VKY81_10645 [Natronosporangium sp.]|nr:hypothetical protein [Natronosporangium sp.]